MTDRLGWADGYWYEDPIAETSSDGLNRTEWAALVARTMARIDRIRELECDRSDPIEIVRRSTLDQSESPGSETDHRLENGRSEALVLVGRTPTPRPHSRRFSQAGTTLQSDTGPLCGHTRAVSTVTASMRRSRTSAVPVSRNIAEYRLPGDDLDCKRRSLKWLFHPRVFIHYSFP